MKRVILAGLFAVSALAACQPEIPNSAAHLWEDIPPPPAAPDTSAGPLTSTPRITASTLPTPEPESATISLDAQDAQDAPLPVQITQNNTGISDQSDFTTAPLGRTTDPQDPPDTVIIAPTALPERKNRRPNVVTYALQTRHPVGERLHQRPRLANPARTQRNCARYASPDYAQEDFLAKGGPQRDRMRLDPDGDGYACEWNPARFRNALGQ